MLRLPLVVAIVAADSLESLQHDNGVAADDLLLLVSHTPRLERVSCATYHHAYPNLLAALLLLDSLVQHNVQENLWHMSAGVASKQIVRGLRTS